MRYRAIQQRRALLLAQRIRAVLEAPDFPTLSPEEVAHHLNIPLNIAQNILARLVTDGEIEEEA